MLLVLPNHLAHRSGDVLRGHKYQSQILRGQRELVALRTQCLNFTLTILLVFGLTLLSFSSSPCRSLDPSSSYISPQKSYALSASNFASRTLTFYLYVFWDRIAMFLALEANTEGRGKHFNKACGATVFRPFIAVLKNGLPFPDCLNSYPCGFYARKVLIQCPIMSILWT